MLKNLNILQKIGGGILLFIIVKLIIDRVITYKPPRPGVDGKAIDPTFDYEAFTLEVKNVIYGFDWTSAKARVFNQLLYMNDEEFKLIYNMYNDRYAKGSNTLKSDIEGEFLFGSGKTALMERFRYLGLP